MALQLCVDSRQLGFLGQKCQDGVVDQLLFVLGEQTLMRHGRQKSERKECECECDLCLDGEEHINHRAEHTHVLCYCVQNSTVGNVGIESVHCICKVSIWTKRGETIAKTKPLYNTDMITLKSNRNHKVLKTYATESISARHRGLTGRRYQEFEMQTLHFLLHRHAQQAPSLPSLRGCHLDAHVPVARRTDSVEQAGEQGIPENERAHANTAAQMNAFTNDQRSLKRERKK